MRTIRLRGEPPPDNAVIVVRSGVLEQRSDTDLGDKASENHDDYGFWGLSVLVVAESGVTALCETDPRVRRYNRVSLSTVGRVRRAGFPLLDTGDAPHFDIVLPDLESATLQRLRDCFDLAQERPPRQLPT